MMENQTEAGWYAITLGIRMLIESGVPLEVIEEKFRKIAEYLEMERV